MSDKILLILDLDETLIHATAKPHDDKWHHEVFGYKVYVRPYLNEFLQMVKEHYTVAVWSSASDDYVEKMVELVFPNEYPLLFVWGRSRATWKPDYSCVEELGYFDSNSHYEYIKRLDKVKRSHGIRLERMLIVDDTPKKSKYNYGNAIYPVEFTGDANDNELDLLGKYLIDLSKVENVRKVEKRFWKNVIY